MARSASYFISRIIKGGRLDVEAVLAALNEAPSIDARKVAWTVVDAQQSEVVYRRTVYRYLAGRLVKYDPDAIVEVVDEATRQVRLQDEPNMQRAASQFVYFPDEALFAHKRVWNEIRAGDFRTQIAEIIVAYHKGFFVDCELEPVVDLGRFLAKLAEFDAVLELKATVSPPNPLFSIFWKDLKQYLDDRRLRKLTIQEAARRGESVLSTAPELARRVDAAEAIDGVPAPIGDAAVFMAADGYGSAVVTGQRGATTAVVKTTQNALQIKLSADASADELAGALAREVVRMRQERGLRH